MIYGWERRRQLEGEISGKFSAFLKPLKTPIYDFEIKLVSIEEHTLQRLEIFIYTFITAGHFEGYVIAERPLLTATTAAGRILIKFIQRVLSPFEICN